MIPVELSSLVINERCEEQVVCLREVEGARELPIVIGVFEALAIDHILKAEPVERPLTHDLLAHVVGQLGGRVSWVVIDDLRDDTFFAKLVLRRQDEEVFIDARPSDGIALAQKLGVPIFVSERVMNAVCPT